MNICGLFINLPVNHMAQLTLMLYTPDVGEAVIVLCDDFRGTSEYGTWSHAQSTVSELEVGNMKVTADSMTVASGDGTLRYELQRVAVASDDVYGDSDPNLYSGKSSAYQWSGDIDGTSVQFITGRSGSSSMLAGILYRPQPLKRPDGTKRMVTIGIAMPYACFGYGSGGSTDYTNTKTSGWYSWAQQWYLWP